MALVANLVHETSTTTGTGSLTLVNVNGKNNFNAAFGTGGSDVFEYFISNQDASEWERGTGSMSDSTTLVRDTVIESTNSNAAVNFSAGTKDVTNDIPALDQTRLVPGSVQATTSGTAFDFTIPAGANRITIIFDSVSLNGTDQVIVQIGDSGGIETTGYSSSSGNRTGVATSTSSFLAVRSGAAAEAINGHMLLTRIDGNQWVESHVSDTQSVAEVCFGGGRKTLSAELTTVRVTRSGTNTFDAGQVNVFSE